MTTINISLSDQMQQFVDEEMGEGGFSDPSDYFSALLQEQLKRKAEQKLEGSLQEGLSTESSAVDKKDWEYIRGELESRLATNRSLREHPTQRCGSTRSNRPLLSSHEYEQQTWTTHGRCNETPAAER
jgi:antitoxin ParD1/3/4